MKKALPVFGALALLAFTLWNIFGIERSNGPVLISCFLLMFGAYVLLVRNRANFPLKLALMLAVVLRLSGFFMDPHLSDDYYRFMWDGRLIVQGDNPYLHTPKEWATEHPDRNHSELLDQMNSDGYYTIYTPVNQVFFAYAALLGKGDLSMELFWLRLGLLAFELLMLFLLSRWEHSKENHHQLFYLYAFNPLVILEIVPNLHFEGVILFWLVLAWFFWQRAKWMPSAVAFGMAISVKLLPLILVPLIFLKMGKARWKFLTVSMGLVVFTVIPLLNMELIIHIWSSIDLYFQKFEFNASFYYVIRGIGTMISGSSPDISKVGPVLSILTVLGICAVALFSKRSFPKMAFWSYLLYFILATTVHPWYIIVPFGIGLLADKNAVLIWTFVVLLSYSHYVGGGFQEQWGWIALEYALFAIAMVIPPDFTNRALRIT